MTQITGSTGCGYHSEPKPLSKAGCTQGRPVSGGVVRVDHNPRYALVVAGGAVEDADKVLAESASLVIAADSGAEFLRKHNLVPRIIVGDFDSSRQETIAYFKDVGSAIIPLDREKDKTDTEVALDIVLDKGFDTAIVIGAMRGKRLDHELANVFLIEHYARQGLDLILYSQDTVIFGILGSEPALETHGPKAANPRCFENSRYFEQKRVFSGKPSDWVTVFPVTHKLSKVTTFNLKFHLQDATLYRGSTLGVSNEMLDRQAGISLAEGFAVVVLNSR